LGERGSEPLAHSFFRKPLDGQLLWRYNKNMPATKKFSPVFIGVSPAGIRWVAYKPEHIETMRVRLAALKSKAAK
jgi:hypothetical protein